MSILPVLDLLEGRVVRGVAGRRDEYRPVESRLAPGSDPLTLARGFRHLGLESLYVADLDAILHGRPNVATWRALADDGFRVLIDAGVRDVARVREALDAGAQAAVLGLETLPGPELLAECCRQFETEQVVFSLDLSGGRPLGNAAAWKTEDPFATAARAVSLGVRRMIVLDLDCVGVSAGVGTRDLCRRLRNGFPELRLITGGGVRDAADLDRLAPLGLEAALVASALHDGRIGPSDLAAFLK